MRPIPLAVAFACLALAQGCRALPAPSQAAPATDVIPATVLTNCAPNAFYSVLVLRATDRHIGAYVLRPHVMDAPIPYLDADGKGITTFAIFDDDATKQAASDIIQRVRSAYPVEEPLHCPGATPG